MEVSPQHGGKQPVTLRVQVMAEPPVAAATVDMNGAVFGEERCDNEHAV